MNRTRLIYLLVFATVGLMQAQKEKNKPNVVVIYTDDHRFSGVHALGGKAVSTPHLDNLAHNGIVFENAYLMGSFTGATCVPSRAMLLTGRNLFELDGAGHNIPTNHTMLGEAFSKAGYNSHIEGKWHQDFESLGRSFDSGGLVMGKPVYLTDHFRMPFSQWNKEGDFPKENAFLIEWDNNKKEKSRPLTKDDKRGPTGTEANGPHSSEIIANGAVNFINTYEMKKKPFFMYVAFHAPHDPRQAPKTFKDMYLENEIALPPSYMPQHPFDNGHLVLRDEELAEWPRTESIAKKQLSDYYAIISHLDEQIGRVIQSLKDSGHYDNTIIVLAGDSGLAVGNHGLMGKQNIYDEDGIHIPFIISGGFIDEKHRGKRESAFCYNYDIMPTLCEMAKISIPKSVTGKSLVPIINGEEDSVRDYTYHAYRQHQRAYRKGDFKLIEYVRAPDNDWRRGHLISGSRVTQLFNINNDPWETFNLSVFPEYQEMVKELRSEMKEKAKELGDDAINQLGLEYDFWNYYK